ncbi:MAG: hypothetical protein KKB03_02185 [Nanoarchaeota archaeon]|nr:hypothetical protein [Nanoarchaeota archaeon]
MADIFQILINIFCPTQSAMQQCSSFVMNHQANFGMLEGLFYFLLFPTVFIIIFGWVLITGVLKKFDIAGPKTAFISILLAFSSYIFIIISGWYPIFLYLSEVWYIGIILIFGFWIFLGKVLGGGNGGGGGDKKGNLLSSLANPLASNKNAKKLTGQLETLSRRREQLLKTTKHPSSGTDTAIANKELRDVEAQMWGCIDDLEDMSSVGPFTVKAATKYRKELEKD